MGTRATAPAELVGRRAEIERLDEVTTAAMAGRGGAVVVRGEAGIGKSALLAHAARTAPAMRVVRASGAEFETELPYAALHQLCVPLLGHLPALPGRHREALEVAFGSRDGTPEVLLVGMAVLDLVIAAGPLLCLVDDAHWLDAASATAVAFLARRIAAEPVAMVIAIRPAPEVAELAPLPCLDVAGLTDPQARELLGTHRHATLDDQVRDQIVAEARGNPLALLEPPSAGGFLPPDPPSVPTAVERGFRARLAELPAQARSLLTVASADPTGDPVLLWAAAEHLGIDVPAASAAATATGLVEFATRIRFVHPLARSAVYRSATPSSRRTANAALAVATDAEVDPDRRAWHRAQA
ncbi:AAA family ATPase, partial [Actinophytocola sediminis]